MLRAAIIVFAVLGIGGLFIIRRSDSIAKADHLRSSHVAPSVSRTTSKRDPGASHVAPSVSRTTSKRDPGSKVRLAPPRTPARVAQPDGHEPPGMSPIFYANGHGLGSWSHDFQPDARFVWDDPLRDTVMELTYGPWVVPPNKTFGPKTHLYHGMQPEVRPVRTLYLRAELKLSANWVQNPSNVLKLFELYIGAGVSPVVGIYGLGSNIRLMVANDNGRDPNYAGAFVGQTGFKVKAAPRPPDIFSVDRWHVIEVVVVSNTPGTSDGRLKTWLDGRPQTEVSDVMWASAGFKNEFFQFDMNPLWGGGAGTLTAPQYLRVGRIYLSGSNAILTGALP